MADNSIAGVGRQLGAEHSQRLESYFQAIPGVQLVACSTPANAKALLKSAIRSDNPVVFFEVRCIWRHSGTLDFASDLFCRSCAAQHVLLYNVKGVTYDDYLQVSDDRRLFPVSHTDTLYAQPLEKAEMVREGTHCTILTYSRMRCVQELRRRLAPRERPD